MIRKSISFLIVAALMLSCSGDTGPSSRFRLRVAVIQMDVVDGDVAENMKRAEKAIRKAAKQGVDMICLPEAVDFGWLYKHARREAFTIPGKYTDLLSGLAKKFNVWVSAGCLEKDGDKTYNSAVLIDRTGRIVLKHRKIITLPELTADLYDAGSADSIKVIDTEFGRIGLTICADNFAIENPQKVADLGAWLLITPHGFAAPVAGLANNAVDFMTHIKRVARETKLWVIGPNTCLSEVMSGKWKGFLHSGCSTIASPDGKVVAFAAFKEPDIMIHGIPELSE